MEIIYLPKAQEDLKFWKKSGRKNIVSKISKLLESIESTPFEGIGKPEQLKHNLSELWSRRIDEEHRIIYEMEGNSIYIYSLKGHYES
jgi:toxin YoeB